MPDWSRLFEGRLNAALTHNNEGKKMPKKASPSRFRLNLELTPPPTVAGQRGVNAVERPEASSRDPRAAFFDAVQRSTQLDRELGRQNVRRISVWPPEEAAPEPLADRTGVALPTVEQKLHESYASKAGDLHGEAVKRLADVHAKLERQLVAMAAAADASLLAIAEKEAMLNKPPSEWVVKVQTRDRPGNAEGTGDKNKSRSSPPIEREERVADRMASMRAMADDFDRESSRLWKEWDQAQHDVSVAWHACFGDGEDDGSTSQSNVIEMGKIISSAEEEMERLASQTMQEMKANEKLFRKLILAEEGKLAQSLLARQSKYD